MKLISRFALILLIMIISTSSSALASSLTSSSFIGTWRTQIKSHITIKKCGNGFCGYLSKVIIRDELYQKNKDAIDKVGFDNAYDYFNKDPALRSRLLKNMRVLTMDMRENDLTYTGEVYNPEDGNTYKGKAEIIDHNTLRVTGCALFGLICQSEDFVRVR